VEAEVLLAQRRQDPGQHRVHADLGRGRARLVEELVELGLHPRDAVARQGLRITVGLELELAELGREVLIL
jgi:hypothetical protein